MLCKGVRVGRGRYMVQNRDFFHEKQSGVDPQKLILRPFTASLYPLKLKKGHFYHFEGQTW